MTKRKFEIVFGGSETAVIELDEAVISAVDDDWRAMFYDLHEPEDIAQHVGYNLIVNHLRLSQMDGWADQPDSNAKVLTHPEAPYTIRAKELK